MKSLKEIRELISSHLSDLRSLNEKGWNPLSLFGATGTALKTCEAQVLYTIIKEKKLKNLLEVGTGSGFSTLYFAHALSELSEGFLDSIDFAEEPSKNAGNLLKMSGVSSQSVNFLMGNSLEVIPALNKEYDFCLIDGSHDYSTSREDFINIYPKIKKGGVIAFHDIQETLTKSTPYQLWLEISQGSLINRDEFSLIQLDHSIHDIFSYHSDSIEISRLASKWLSASWIKGDISPMSMMGLLFKNED